MNPEIGIKDRRVSIRVPAEMHELIARAAKARSKSPSDFMLESSCEAARGVLEEETRVVLPKETWERFLAVLDAPPAPNAALRELMTRPSVWDAAG